VHRGIKRETSACENPIAAVPHAAFEHIADAELVPNLADIERPGPYKANERVSER